VSLDSVLIEQLTGLDESNNLASLTRLESGANLEEVVSLHEQVEQLFREARNDLYYYILSFGLTAHEAQEITQDVFLRFYVSLKRGEAIENSRGWIFRVGHNLAVNAAKRTATRRLFVLEPRRAVETNEESPEERLIRKQNAGKLREALAALSPQQRLCLQLRAEGLRYVEIAKTIGVGTSTVGEFLSRAIRTLRKAVQEK
jgi:RNA polymerase sigma-70 factor (ECF subfamily)